MTSPPTIDIEHLASPVTDEYPAGQYLRETDYARLQRAKDERANAMTIERKQRELLSYSDEDLEMIPEEDRKLETPNWALVRDLCVEILSDHSKDLWVASWLIEANTRLNGFAGLRDGFLLTTKLVQNFWDNISPPPDEEGYLGTVSQLASLNGEDGPGTLLIPIRSLTLVPGESGMSLASYIQATEGSGGEHSEAEFLGKARQLDPDRLRDHAEDIEGAIDAYQELNSCLMERCEQITPPSSQVSKLLGECDRVFRLITRDVLSNEQSEIQDADDVADATTVVASSGQALTDSSQAQVNNREDAFRMLLRASEFFRKTEPHSPVSYMLEQAVRFGRMELPELLQTLIPEKDVLTHFAERTGIELEPESDED